MRFWLQAKSFCHLSRFFLLAFALSGILFGMLACADSGKTQSGKKEPEKPEKQAEQMQKGKEDVPKISAGQAGSPAPHQFQGTAPVLQKETIFYNKQEGLWHERYGSASADGRSGHISTSATQVFDVASPVALNAGQPQLQAGAQTGAQTVTTQAVTPGKGSFVLARATSDAVVEPLSRQNWALALQVPPPVDMSQVILLKLESGMMLALPWGTCLPQIGCVATLKLTQNQFTQIRDSSLAEISFARPRGQPVSAALSLEGLDKALITLDGWAAQSPLLPAEVKPPETGAHIVPQTAPQTGPQNGIENPLLQKRGRLF